jgi:hypothetical protein
VHLEDLFAATGLPVPQRARAHVQQRGGFTDGIALHDEVVGQVDDVDADFLFETALCLLAGVVAAEDVEDVLGRQVAEMFQSGRSSGFSRLSS